MIKNSEIKKIGVFFKPHGLGGEISAEIYDYVDIAKLRCVIVDIDGINVPFFISSFRTKGTDTYLLKIEDYDSAEQVEVFSGKSIFASITDLPEMDDIDEGVLYLEDIVGFKAVMPDGTVLGTITSYDDSTANILIAIDTPAGDQLYVPFVDEFIGDADSDSKTVVVNIPDEMLNLNRKK